jgi:hypothetical protein
MTLIKLVANNFTIDHSELENNLLSGMITASSFADEDSLFEFSLPISNITNPSPSSSASFSLDGRLI